MAKKVKVTITTDLDWTAEKLHDLATFIDYEVNTGGFTEPLHLVGDHYTADIELV